MFLLLGVITDIKELTTVVTAPALLAAVALMVLARPFAAVVCLLPFRYPAREVAFIGWVGMRGAVPIVLALFPLLAGLPQASLLFHLAFLITLLSLLLQGGTLHVAARMARVQRPRGAQALSSATLEGGEPPREVVQFQVAAGASAAIRALDDVPWPSDVRVIEVCRGGELVRVDRLAPDDLVTVVAPADALAAVEDLFGAPLAATELAIDPATTVGELLDYYGVELPADTDAGTLLTAFVQQRLRKRGAVGDAVVLDGLTVTVRQSEGGVVQRVGLRLLAPPR
jgi:cell volume regulation protein A